MIYQYFASRQTSAGSGIASNSRWNLSIIQRQHHLACLDIAKEEDSLQQKEQSAIDQTVGHALVVGFLRQEWSSSKYVLSVLRFLFTTAPIIAKLIRGIYFK